MIVHHQIRLATFDDAPRMAEMSRDLIEHGLRWAWTPARIRHSIANSNISAAVAPAEGGIAGFAIMQYKDDEAHLLLLGVDPRQRRRGVARALIDWHEQAALIAGIGTVYVEARARESGTRAFYRALGYREVQRVRGYYQGVEDALTLAKDLWASASAPDA